MATSSLRGRDQPQGAAGSVLDVICQNSLACSSWEAPLFCELTGHGLGTKEEMEFRWLKSATLCPPGMPSWLHPQRQGSSLWLFQALTGQESWIGHTCPSCVQQWPLSSLCGQQPSHPFSTGKTVSQSPQHPHPGQQRQCLQDKHPDLAGGPRHCRPTLRPSPSLRASSGPPTQLGWLLPPKLLLLWQAQLTGAQASPSAPGSKGLSLLQASQDPAYLLPRVVCGRTHRSLDTAAQTWSGPDSQCPAWDRPRRDPPVVCKVVHSGNLWPVETSLTTPSGQKDGRL